MASPSIKDVMGGGYEDEASESDAHDVEGESAYVEDLKSAMDSGDAQKLYDTICAIILAKGGGGAEEHAAPAGKGKKPPSLAIVLGR